MPERNEKAEEILDVAERLARAGGYGGFSFRDLAKAVGIKSASVHYHFPSKEDLGIALTGRYTDRFLKRLGDPVSGDPSARISDYVAAFRKSLVEDGLMCLCGLFGAEIDDLPTGVAEETRRFFERNRDWLVVVLERHANHLDAGARETAALDLIARLQGAMILSRSLSDPSIFDRVMSEDLPA